MDDFLVVVFGLIVGSFLNVCIYRLPRDLSLIRPGSSCPECGQGVRWSDNIPVLGFLRLRGRCRHCHKAISPRYVLVEIINALLWFFLWQRHSTVLEFAFSALLFSILLAIFFTDFETGLIPDELSLGGLAAGLVFAALMPERFGAQDWQGALLASGLGALTGGGLLYLTGCLGQLLFRKECMGFGDVKLLAMLGSFIGSTGILFVFLGAPVLALPFALFERVVRKEEAIPFGPYLVLAGAAVYLWEQPLRSYFFGY